ncbi:MAG TPA: GNAT family N-acetyltransferase [Solirubrobacteraceae bacterium]|jgi:ElaA protein|nr:GNAT family N-acetyltransferase [Solirubrobacteraceae bacterium]
MGGPTEIRWALGPEDRAGALALREDVFCGEQGVLPEEEVDGRDDDAEHLVAVDVATGAVVGTLRLLTDGATAKIGRVAVARERRREGIALEMLGRALARAAEIGCTRAILAAQTKATDVYRRAGFAVESGVFLEARIEHVWMARAL